MESVVYAPKKKLMEIKVRTWIGSLLVIFGWNATDSLCELKQGVSEQKAEKIQLEAMKLVSSLSLFILKLCCSIQLRSLF